MDILNFLLSVILGYEKIALAPRRYQFLLVILRKYEKITRFSVLTLTEFKR